YQGVAPRAVDATPARFALPPAARRRVNRLLAACASSSLCRGYDLPRRDLVLEAVRIEAVHAAARGLRLRIHQELEGTGVRAGQAHVVAEVVGDPVHLPRPEETGARA